jgi:3-methylcrotonyl-CoA carboxylase alpha subunit
VIRSALIANRGEIAVRIMRTCRRLGIRTIAVYSDADRDALHVRTADEAVRIGPAPARDSYLRADAILDAARRSGAEAIHPGYGFLSEKPVLPLLCAEAGIVFVGPLTDCIEAMGSKIGAKAVAAKAGVPSVPGYAGADQSTERLLHEARAIGLPVMVKASAGGGGKGMRRVLAEADLLPALDLARREAEAAFGDPSLLLERLVLRPRHLEVQVAGDRHGNVVHLFERDCSVQRNNQKVLEEAPAPNLDPRIRERLLQRGVALAEAIAYDNLGTVEFILEEGGDEPWFLEMNTRLQVEHPVTELITGLDLVEWQIRIASGERLPLLQDGIAASGHAIEARVTAERVDLDFRPDAGRILAVREPAGLRIDSGVAPGSEVTLFYDSLLAKAVAHGATREGARATLEAGLRDFVVLGPETTLAFLADAVAHPAFVAGAATTSFIADAFPEGWRPARRYGRLARAIAAVLKAEGGARGPSRLDPSSPWARLLGFRVLAPAGGLAEARLSVEENGTISSATVLARPGGWLVRSGEQETELTVARSGDRVEVASEGRTLQGHAALSGDDVRIHLSGEAYAFTVRLKVEAASSDKGSGRGKGSVLAPMPGVVAEVRVRQGETVEAGQVLVVLESMKLFVSLKAEIDGTVTRVECRPNETVAAGRRLVTIEGGAIVAPTMPRVGRSSEEV